MAFYVGQRVECIDDGWRRPNPWVTRFPKKSEIFTIREIFISKDDGRTQCLRLDEIQCGVCRLGNEVGFEASSFRPIVERKTDISIFESLLNPANHKQLEGV
jgi:hypothetical protein